MNRPYQEDTDKAIVVVGCHDDTCVNLIVPRVATGARRDLNALVRGARVANVPNHRITAAAATFLNAANVAQDEMVARIQQRIQDGRDQALIRRLSRSTGSPWAA